MQCSNAALQALQRYAALFTIIGRLGLVASAFENTGGMGIETRPIGFDPKRCRMPSARCRRLGCSIQDAVFHSFPMAPGNESLSSDLGRSLGLLAVAKRPKSGGEKWVGVDPGLGPRYSNAGYWYPSVNWRTEPRTSKTRADSHGGPPTTNHLPY
ncbi:hypothetical protein K440DRAFT_191308 [Wilcoxina mikolae CBS 423.85]|nr:hypothetical protein K440DRAFT_191308 [Wilcoxina mikolae CBS 423.85]